MANMYQERSDEIYAKALEYDSDKVELANQMLATSDIGFIRLMAENVRGVPVGRLLESISSPAIAHRILKQWYETRDYLKISIYEQHIIMYSIPALLDDDNLYLSHFQPKKQKRKCFKLDT